MTFEEDFYIIAPGFKNQSETKLKCLARRCDDSRMFSDGYYEFSIDGQEYQQYHISCEINTIEEEAEWIEKVYLALADQIENLFQVCVDMDDEQGYWAVDYFPVFTFSYIYDAYNDIA